MFKGPPLTPRLLSPAPARVARCSPPCLFSQLASPGRFGAPLPPLALLGAAGTLRVAVAGAMVGFGTALGNGCTSGHGIAGNARLSPRSMAATAAFMATGFAAASLGGTTVWLVSRACR